MLLFLSIFNIFVVYCLFLWYNLEYNLSDQSLDL